MRDPQRRAVFVSRSHERNNSCAGSITVREDGSPLALSGLRAQPLIFFRRVAVPERLGEIRLPFRKFIVVRQAAAGAWPRSLPWNQDREIRHAWSAAGAGKILAWNNQQDSVTRGAASLGLWDVVIFGRPSIFGAAGCTLEGSRVIRAQRKANVHLRAHPCAQLRSRFRKHARGFVVPTTVPCAASPRTRYNDS